MEKLTSNRYYFDFNATSPLVDPVKSWLAKGDFSFANPSSIHSSGKLAKRSITKTKRYLFDLFSLNENEFKLIFHSGATEAINMFFKGFLYEHNKGTVICVGTDHSAFKSQFSFFKDQGFASSVFPVDEFGKIDLEKSIQKIKEIDGPVLLNYTWVNNETGVVFSLEDAIRIKKETGCFIHVDAVQSIGKIPYWKELKSELDAYTFSGHKFGSLKGVGFSFVKDSFSFLPLLHGGGQQEGLRSGTENIMGIESLRLALEYLDSKFDPSELLKAKTEIENQVQDLIGDSGEIVSIKVKERSLSMISFVLYKTKSDIASVAFDLAGMDVSTGSACSSGAVVPSQALLAMGYNEDQSKSLIRLSFSPYLTVKNANEYAEKISKVLERFV